MEVLLDELKQYDLELVSELEKGNYYVEYVKDETIGYFYYYINDFVETIGALYYKINYPNFNYLNVVDIFINFYQNTDIIDAIVYINSECSNTDKFLVLISQYPPDYMFWCNEYYIFNTDINLLNYKEKINNNKDIVIIFKK